METAQQTSQAAIDPTSGRDCGSWSSSYVNVKLEQLERLRSEDTLRRPMITHTIDQFILDRKSKQDKVNVTNLKNLPKLQILTFEK